MSSSPSSRTWVSLQCLRGLAALLVVGFHVSEQMERRLGQSFLGGALRMGWCGLDLFFVLSGFIIAWVHAGDLGRPERLVPYLRKRAQRIYPLYWSLMVPATLVAFLVPQFATDRERSLDVLVRSWLLWPLQGLPLLGVAWTLCHEVFFYLLFALGIVLPGWGRWLAWTAWVAGTAVAGATVNGGPWPMAPGSSGPPLWVAFVLNPLNLEFVAGCLLGGWFHRQGSRSALDGSGRWHLTLLLPALGVVVGWARLQGWIPASIPGPLARAVLMGGAGTLAIAALIRWESARGAAGPMPKLLGPWAAVGDASYSLYLLHYPLLVVSGVLLRRLDPQGAVPSTVTGFALLGLAVLAGVAWHRAVERPLLRWVRHLGAEGQKSGRLAAPA